MTKIWMVDYKGYSGRKYYKTEAAFMEAIGNGNTRATVTIFQEIESHNALEYKNNLITQREREQQLQIILEDNQEVAILSQIRDEIKKWSVDKNNWTIKAILKKLDTRGLNSKNFKQLATDSDIRKFLLYTGPSSKEWYKMLRQIHGFKMESEYPVSYDWKTKKHKKIQVETERLKNFQLACEELKKEKKNAKKEDTSV